MVWGVFCNFLFGGENKIRGASSFVVWDERHILWHTSCSLLSLNARLFSWPLILVKAVHTSSRSPNYLKTISANLPPRHWEMKRKLSFLVCERFRMAERGSWGQEMTKELITEEYSYFNTVRVFRDVRTKKANGYRRHQKGQSHKRSCNSGW